MITSKAIIIQTIKECADGKALSKVEKFQVFCNVCDNLLAEGNITEAKHHKWTNVF
jgi:hypothetical protein|tara:strand:- start:39281 stop:39448 length:168 start_codon:yes stop_codon:yes gene_type:complete